MTRFRSRPYQIDIIRKVLRFFASGVQRIQIQLATGAGKTHIATELVHRFQSRRVLYTVPSTEIFDQTGESLHRAGLGYATLQAGQYPDLTDAQCVLASNHTLNRRLLDGRFPEHWAPDIIFIDESHKLYDQLDRLLRKWPEALVIALSATPVRLDGKPIHELFTHMVPGPPIPTLQQQGYLADAVTYEAPMPDLSAVAIRNGDYSTAQLEGAYDAAALEGTIPDLWRWHARDRPTVAFTSGVSASLALVEAFQAQGVSAMHVDGDTPDHERKQAFAKLRSGRIKVLSNCQLVVEGVDVPSISAIILATATMSLSRYMQMVGRGLRTSPGKKNLVVIDCGDNCMRHGPVDADRDWLRGGVPVTGEMTTCASCHAVIRMGSTLCPICYKPPEGLRGRQSTRSRQRKRKALSRSTPLRLCPPWAMVVRKEWLRAEHLRVRDNLPLSFTENRARRALKKHKANRKRRRRHVRK